MRHFKHTLVCAITALMVAPLFGQDVVTLSIRDVIERQALLFPADGDTGVLLAHQSGKDAQSWAGFAQRLQDEGYASIALESISTEDVMSGVEHLRQAGKTRIALIGGSIGGGGIQSAVSKGVPSEVVLVVLLGTASGNMAEANSIEKLFVITENDFFSAQTYSSYDKAADPKDLVVYPGKAHGQEMFDEPYGPQLVDLILRALAN